MGKLQTTWWIFAMGAPGRRQLSGAGGDMRVVHRLSFRLTEAREQALVALGIGAPKAMTLPGSSVPLAAFDLSEDHPRWAEMQAWLREEGLDDGIARVEFTEEEIAEAGWLGLMAWHHGYPEPKSDEFGYREVTYDLTRWCEKCGCGATQKANFQMKGEPAWGRHGVLQLTWVYDELFVTPEVWRKVFAPVGIACTAVLDTRGTPLETVVQLVVDEEVGIETGGLVAQRCARCRRSKFAPVVRDRLPALVGQAAKPLAKTGEYFGAGASAFRLLLVSNAVARSLAETAPRGLVLQPVKTPRVAGGPSHAPF